MADSFFLSEQELIRSGINEMSAKAIVEAFERSGGQSIVTLNQSELEVLLLDVVALTTTLTKIRERISALEQVLLRMPGESPKLSSLERRISQLEAMTPGENPRLSAIERRISQLETLTL